MAGTATKKRTRSKRLTAREKELIAELELCMNDAARQKENYEAELQKLRDEMSRREDASTRQKQSIKDKVMGLSDRLIPVSATAAKFSKPFTTEEQDNEKYIADLELAHTIMDDKTRVHVFAMAQLLKGMRELSRNERVILATADKEISDVVAGIRYWMMQLV